MDVDEALNAVDRRDFLPEEVQKHAHEDRPLSIGYGQTNSQPSTVRVMLEWLNVLPGQKVLDVGSGSGWTTALLSKLVGKTGYVHAVEIVPELVDYGRDNIDRAGVTNTAFHEATKDLGLPKYAPFNRILVSASTATLPSELVHQLTAPGKMVIPIGETIYEIEKDQSGAVTETHHYGFVFVPLIT